MQTLAATLALGLGVVGAASSGNLCWEASARGQGFEDSMSDESCKVLGVHNSGGAKCKDMNLWCIVNCELNPQQHPVCADNDVLGGTGAPWCRAVPCKGGNRRWFASTSKGHAAPLEAAASASTKSADMICTQMCGHDSDSLICQDSKKAVGSPWCLKSPPSAAEKSTEAYKIPMGGKGGGKPAAGGKGAGTSPKEFEAMARSLDLPAAPPAAPPSSPEAVNFEQFRVRSLHEETGVETSIDFGADVDMSN